MVPDSPDVRDVLAGGDGGVFDNAKPGTLIIDFSSIRPDVTAELAEAGHRSAASGSSTRRCPAARPARSTPRCRSWSAAPPRTSPPPSRSSTSSARPSCTSGPNGAGQTVKAANQLIVAGNIQVLAEAIMFLQAYGVDTEAALKVLGGGLAGSQVLTRRARRCSTASSSPASGSTCTTRTWASSPPRPARPASSIPLGAVVAQLMASALANGDGGLDHSALLRGVERLSGQLTHRRRPRPAPATEGKASAMPRMTRPTPPSRSSKRKAPPSLRAARRGDQPVLLGHARPRRAQAHPGPARRGRLAHGRGLHPRQRPATSASASAPPARPAPT